MFGSIISRFPISVHVLAIPNDRNSPAGSIASEYSVVSGEIRYRYAGPPFGDLLTGKHVKKLVFNNGFPPPPYRGSCTGSVACEEQVLSAERTEVCVDSSVDRYDTAGQAILDSTNVAQSLSVNLSNEVDQVAAMSSSIINHVASVGDAFVVIGFRPNPIVVSTDFSALRSHPGCTFYWLRKNDNPAPTAGRFTGGVYAFGWGNAFLKIRSTISCTTAMTSNGISASDVIMETKIKAEAQFTDGPLGKCVPCSQET